MLSPKEGGRWDAAEGKGDSPFEVVRAYLKNGRCELKDKQLIFKNKFGKEVLDEESLLESWGVEEKT